MVSNGFKKFFRKANRKGYRPDVLSLLEDGYTIHRVAIERARMWIDNGFTHRAADGLCHWRDQPDKLRHFLRNCYFREVDLDILEDLVEYLEKEGELIG